MRTNTANFQNTSPKTVFQHRLRCAQTNDAPKNGSAISVTGTPVESGDNGNFSQLSVNVAKLTDSHKKLQGVIRKVQILQLCTIALMVVIGALLAYLFHTEFSHSAECYAREL